MEARVRRLFGADVLQEAGDRMGFDPSGAKALDATESFVFACDVDGAERVVRITSASRRSADYVRGEIDWIEFLAARGVSVAASVPSRGGHRVETLGQGEREFLATLFRRAPGRKLEVGEFRPHHLREWGVLLARMHSATRYYACPDPRWRRQQWYEEEQLRIDRWAPQGDRQLIDSARRILGAVEDLPTSPEVYGLIHTDLHRNNLHFHGSRVTAFDFDDCGYNWFVNDIAAALYYFVRKISPMSERVQRADWFLEHLVAGYRGEAEVHPAWLARIPLFLRLRHVLMYVVLRQASQRLASPSEQAEIDRTAKEIIEGASVLPVGYRPHVS